MELEPGPLRDAVLTMVEEHEETWHRLVRESGYSRIAAKFAEEQILVRNELLGGFGVHTIEVKEEMPAPDWDTV